MVKRNLKGNIMLTFDSHGQEINRLHLMAHQTAADAIEYAKTTCWAFDQMYIVPYDSHGWLEYMLEHGRKICPLICAHQRDHEVRNPYNLDGISGG
jgi:hypothetical protein